MKEMEIMSMFSSANAYQKGHFKLSSGLHSGAYFQCALVLQNPVLANRLALVLADKFRQNNPDVVIGPAMGGVILAYELARVLNARAIFTERDPAGKMMLRRGFHVLPENRVLIAEDVLTTGKSIKEVVSILREDGVTPVGIACIVDRSTERIDFGSIKHESLIRLEIPLFEEARCPLCQEGMPLIKPGTRQFWM